MKELKGNTFLYFGDKNVSKVSVIWKALHISIYIAIALNAFMTSMAAGNMFQTFKYNCILFCTEIVFEKEILPTESSGYTSHSPINNEDLSKAGDLMIESLDYNSTIAINNVHQGQNVDNVTDDDIILSNTTADILTNNNNLDKISSSTSEMPKSRVNGTIIIFKNQTHIVQNEEDSTAIILAKIDLRKSIFPSNFWCNFVLGIALITFIFATFCVVILAMCSKGGKGRNNTLNRPQNMIYPILVSSILLGILNLVASIAVKNGMKGFCASFQLFTGDKSCSPLINKFTLHERQGNFYLPYVVLAHTCDFTVIFFLFQVIVTFLRVIYAVDYQLYSLDVEEDNEEERAFEIEDGRIVKEMTL